MNKRTLKLKRKAVAGLSLMEVVIAMAVMAVVMLLTYSILHSTTNITAKGHLTTNLEARGREFLNRCKSDFVDARFNDNGNTGLLGIHDDGTQIHYMMALKSNTTGTVDYGMIGGKLDFISGVPDYTPWINCSAIIRFEPELILLEPAATNPGVKQTVTADQGAPTDWQRNRYVVNAPQLTPGVSLLPTLTLKKNINLDNDSTDVYVKGALYKYVMPPYVGTPFTLADVLTKERLSDDVILGVLPTGKFTGEIDTNYPTTPVGKDWLFRYLAAEPFVVTTYGNTDDTWMVLADTDYPKGVFPGTNSVALMVTVWHAVEDDSGKGFYLMRKAWERIPFRLSKLTGS
jgi:hypothetical protein